MTVEVLRKDSKMVAEYRCGVSIIVRHILRVILVYGVCRNCTHISKVGSDVFWEHSFYLNLILHEVSV